MNRTAVSIFAMSAVVSAAIAAAPAIAQSPASDNGSRTVCARGADERIIEIVSPGEVGARCDVRYTRDGGANVRTPYHANNSADFCAEKAAELVSELRAAGFQCDAGASPGAPALRGGTQEAPASDFVIETQRGAPPVESGPAETGPADVGGDETAPEEEPAPEEGGAEQTPPAEDEGTFQEEASLEEAFQEPVPETVQPSQDDELAALMNEILSQPVSETLEQPVETAAVRGPANLTEGVSDEMTDAAPSVSSVSAGAPVGRLAGADPMTDETPALSPELSQALLTALDLTPSEQSAPEPVVPITQAAVAETPLETLPEPAPSETAAALAARPETTVSAAPQPSQAQPEPQSETRPAPQPEPQSEPQTEPQPVRQAAVEAPVPVATTSGVPTLLRRPADIVRATVRAQAAAWNEGNLEAFMDVYARDDDLVYVSGDEVTRGWSAARKRYRDRYDGPAGMGRIDFEKLDAELVTEDVAVVTGRVRHAIGEEMSKAVFSMVMKREQGVWRIVHDHTAPAATASQ